MGYDEGHARSSDGPTCLVAILAPFLVLCAIVGYVTLDRGGVRQQDEATGALQVLTWHGWEPAGEPARQLSASPAPAYGEANPTAAPLPTPLPAPVVVMVVPTVGDVVLAPAAVAGDETTKRYTGHSDVEPTPAVPGATASLSPWTLLGWILVVLVPFVLITGTVLAVHRYLTTTRRRPGPGRAGPVPPDGALPAHVIAESAAGPAPPAGGSPEGDAPPASSERTYIADFLEAERVPEAVAIGGYDGAPVHG